MKFGAEIIVGPVQIVIQRAGLPRAVAVDFVVVALVGAFDRFFAAANHEQAVGKPILAGCKVGVERRQAPRHPVRPLPALSQAIRGRAAPARARRSNRDTAHVSKEHRRSIVSRRHRAHPSSNLNLAMGATCCIPTQSHSGKHVNRSSGYTSRNTRPSSPRNLRASPPPASSSCARSTRAAASNPRPIVGQPACSFHSPFSAEYQ